MYMALTTDLLAALSTKNDGLSTTETDRQAFDQNSGFGQTYSP